MKKTHGMSNTRTYQSWNHMKQRCLNKNNDRFDSYLGRGIKVCKRWLKFENFYEDMGDRPEGMTLDRIDNNKGYYKNNCKWSLPIEQGNNTRRNIVISYQGKKLTLAQWSRKLNINYAVLRDRFKRNLPIGKVLYKNSLLRPREYKIKCVSCGKIFYKIGSDEKRRKTCSKECLTKFKRIRSRNQFSN